MPILRQRIEEGTTPFIVLDGAQSIFDACSDDLVLLDKVTLKSIVLVYTYDRFLSELLSRLADENFTKFPKELRMQAFWEFEKFNAHWKNQRDEALVRLSEE